MTARWKSRCLAGFAAASLTACSAAHPDPPSTQTADLLTQTRPPDTTFFGSTPFELVQNAIRVRADLDGREAASPLLMDSGAPMTLASAIAAEFELEPGARVTLAGPDGRHEPADVVVLPRVGIAGQTFHNVGAVVDWVTPPNPVACLSTVGLIGASLMRSAIWQIDFHARRITVTDQVETLPGIEFAMRLPFRQADAAGSPRVDVTLPKVGKASLLIDLGFNGSIAMPENLYRRAGGIVEADTPAQRGHGAATALGDVESTFYIGRAPRLDLGALRLEDFPVLTGGDISDFHVGVAFLRHFRATIDWKNDALYLQRRDPEHELRDDYASYGFTPVLQDGAFVVGALWRGGAAARAGLQMHDRIVALDGDDLEADFDTYCSLLDAIGLYGGRSEAIDVTVVREDERRVFSIRRTPLIAGP